MSTQGKEHRREGGSSTLFVLSTGGTNHECFFKMALTFLNNLQVTLLSAGNILQI